MSYTWLYVLHTSFFFLQERGTATFPLMCCSIVLGLSVLEIRVARVIDAARQASGLASTLAHTRSSWNTSEKLSKKEDITTSTRDAAADWSLKSPPLNGPTAHQG